MIYLRNALLVSVFLLCAFVQTACADSSRKVDIAPTDTPLPTKVAYVIPTVTYTPTATRTPTPTVPSTPTRTRTRTPLSPTPTVKSPSVSSAPSASPSLTPTSVRPLVVISGEKYGTLSVLPRETNRAASEVNLAVRGYITTIAKLGLVDIDGPADPAAPPFSQLLADHRLPTFTTTYRVYAWDLNCNCRGEGMQSPEVTMAGLAAYADELIRVPDSGYNIGEGFEVLVLYADVDRITLSFTREDNPVRGYCLYLEGVAVESTLLSLYQWAHSTGRGELPALRAGQAFARAKGTEVKFAIRDAGAFMDPRSRKDWWQR